MNHSDKKNKKNYKLIIIFLIVIIVVSLTSSFGRYAINAVNDFYLRSKEFYFYSDKLTSNGSIFRVDNWSGIDDYNITINMNSRENNILATSYDINYNISYTCSDNIICTLSKESGTILSSTNADYFNIRITPNKQLKEGDKVYVELTASTTQPYTKAIKGQFILNVGKEELTYKIVDSPNNQYFDLDLTNTLSYYMVETAFDSYNVGDKLTEATFKSLSADKQAKCYSAEVTIKFDPNVEVLDMVNTNYLNALNVTNTTKNNYNYINGMTFKLEALSSAKVRFYKNNITKDYTYPNSSGTASIITVSSK